MHIAVHDSRVSTFASPIPSLGKDYLFLLVFSLLFLFLPENVRAQNILNDECTGAINIQTNGSSQSTTFSNIGATLSIPGCSQPADNDVWFKFTATATRHQVKAITTDFEPMVLEVFSGDCTTLTSIACQFNPAEDITMADIKGLVPGTTYYYRVYMPGGSAKRVNFRTYIFTPATPVNDECRGAIQLPVNKGNSSSLLYNGVLGDATQSIPSCVANGLAAKDVWYKFTATSSHHKVTVTPTIYRDYIFEVFSGDCNSLTSLGCVNETISDQFETKVFNNLIPGNTYYMRVYNYFGWADESCTFNISINEEQNTISNDECTGAINIPTDGSSRSTAFTNIGATLSMPGCSQPADNDVWFKFTATATRHQVMAVTTYSNPMVLQLFKGDCSALTSFACQFNPAEDATIADFKDLVPGTIYYYRVYLPGGSSQRVNFRTYIFTPVTPVNDECEGAIQLPVNKNNSCAQYYSGTLGDATQSIPPCIDYGFAAKDLWYKFTATTVQHKVTVKPTIYRDYVFEVFSGDYNSLTSLGCVNETGSDQSETRVFKNLVPGNTYYMRVYNYYGAVDESCTFDICINQEQNTILNDECMGAINIPTDGSTQSNAFTNVGATLSMPGCSQPADNDVWFKFTATATRHQIKAITADFEPMVLEVFKGDCSALTSFACEFNQAEEITMADIKDLVPGTTYYYRVYMPRASTKRSNFRTYIFTPTTPVNDECAGAIQLSVNNNNSCNQSYSGAIGDATQSMPPCVNYGVITTDVWHKFTATTTNHTVTLTPGGFTDFIFEVFEGTCDNLKSMGCTNLTGFEQSEQQTLTNLIPGNTYYIRIYNRYGNSSSSTTYRLCISTPSPKPILTDPGKHCGLDTLRVRVENIEPGSTVEAYLNTVTPINFDPVKKEIWAFPVSTGSNIIKLTQKNAGIVSELAEVTVTTVSPVTPTMTITASGNTICDHTPVIFQAQTVHGGDAPVLKWMVNEKVVHTGDLFTYSDFANNDQVTAQMTSTEFCITSPLASSEQITMNVLPLVQPRGKMILPKSICATTAFDVTINIEAASTPLQSSLQLMEIDPSGIVNTIGSKSYNGSSLTWNISGHQEPGIRKYFATITPFSSTACGVVNNTDTLEIAVVNRVTPTLTITASDNNICDHTPVTFQAQAVHGGDAPVFKWLVNEQIVYTGHTFTYADFVNNDQVTAQMTSTEFCTTGPTAGSEQITIHVLPNVQPRGKIVLPASICSASAFDVTVNLESGSTPLQSSLQLMEMDPAGRVKAIASKSYNGSSLTWTIPGHTEPGIRKYFATITPSSSTRCGTVNNTDTLEISVAKKHTVPDINRQGTMLFTTESSTGVIYQWQIKNGNNWEDISGSRDTFLILLQTKEYRLKTTLGVCTAYSNEIKADMLEQLSLFPNPTTGRITINPLLATDNWNTLEIRNLTGTNNLLRHNIKGKTQVSIDVSHLLPGIYLIILKGEHNNTRTRKFIKM